MPTLIENKIADSSAWPAGPFPGWGLHAAQPRSLASVPSLRATGSTQPIPNGPAPASTAAPPPGSLSCPLGLVRAVTLGMHASLACSVTAVTTLFCSSFQYTQLLGATSCYLPWSPPKLFTGLAEWECLGSGEGQDLTGVPEGQKWGKQSPWTGSK